jgi:hypothetical protein
VVRIQNGSTRLATGTNRPPWRVMSDDDGRLLFTDQADAVVEYTVSITDVSRFTPDFVQALALKLAAYIAPSLTGGDPTKLRERNLALYAQQLRIARWNDAQGSQADVQPDSGFVTARVNKAQRSFAGGEITPSLLRARIRSSTPRASAPVGTSSCSAMAASRTGRGPCSSSTRRATARAAHPLRLLARPDAGLRARLHRPRHAGRAGRRDGHHDGRRRLGRCDRLCGGRPPITAAGDVLLHGRAHLGRGGQCARRGHGLAERVVRAQTGTLYEIPTPYLAADLPTLQVVQSADVLTIVHPSYAPRELRRTGHTHWVLTPIAFGPGIGSPGTLALSGGGRGAIRYWAVTAIDGDTQEEGLAGSSRHESRPGLPARRRRSRGIPSTGRSGTASTAPTMARRMGSSRALAGTPADITDTSWTTTTALATTTTPLTWVAPGPGAESRRRGGEREGLRRELYGPRAR